MAKEPASIRYKNPGAMWGSALAIKWGAAPKAVTLNDGKGQGNNIAVFPTYVQGICAQLDLWRTSKNYRNKKFKDAIAVWSGGNNVESYVKFVLDRVPGMKRNTVMNDKFWRSQMGIAFLKAQAWHEAGKRYPAPEADWIEAQRRVFDGAAKPSKPKPAALKPAPSAEPPHGQKDERFAIIQRRLVALGIFEVGDPGGEWGSRTAAGIAAFKSARGMAGPPLPDDALDAEISKAEAEGWTRPIAPARAEADDKKVAEVSDAIPAAKQNGLMAWLLGLPAAALTFFSSIASYFKELWDNDLVVSIREFAADNIGIIAGAIAIFAVFQWYTANRAKNATTEAYQEGRLT